MNDQPILYVEDEEDYQILVRRILEKAGLPVCIAESGSAGFKTLERLRPRLLILDINLPDTDGYAFCNRIRQDPNWKEIPVVMLTVRRRLDEWIRGFSSGADDYLPKPLNPPELVQRIRSCLEGKTRRSTARGEFALIQAAHAGNRAAFEVLILQFRDRLISNLRPLTRNIFDAEDVAASAFTVAYERLEQFHGKSSFYTWLYRIAVNETYRLKRRIVGVSLDVLASNEEAVPPELTEPDAVNLDLVQQVRQIRIQEAVATVPRPYQQMLRWHFIRGLSYHTMSRRLHIPRGTIMSRLFKARRLLREAWDQQDAR